MLGAIVLLLGCADDGDGAPGRAGRLAVDVAALSLAGVGDVVWDLEVINGDGDVVWQRRVTSSGYGDGAGSASYVGSCDAAAGVSDNTVRVWVVGIYADPVSATSAGTFAAGADTGAGAVAATPLPLANPTAAGPLTRTVDCQPDRDAAVTFEVTLTRPAAQGFFDVAMSFNDIFCSAKLDCCDDATGDGCTADEHIALLFDGAGARARTIILGFACTAGVADGVDTRLYLDPIHLDCTPPHAGAAFAPDLALDPARPAAGNQCPPGDIADCPAVDDVTGAVDPDAVLFQLATFRGDELLGSGGAAAHKVYWNVALGVTTDISACRLRTRGAADDAAREDDSFVAGAVTPGAVYPYVQWDADLGTCGSEGLTFGVAGAAVTTAYSATTGDPIELAYFYGPTVGAGAFCDPVPELCDGVDNDCDGPIDEGCDDDGDDYCDATMGYAGSSPACPLGGGDLDDGDPGVNPGVPVCTPVTELCDGVDNDCDGPIDEGCDDDGDDYCDASMGYSGSPPACPLGGGDANDNDPLVNPSTLIDATWGDTTVSLAPGTYEILAWGAAGGPGYIPNLNPVWYAGGGGGFARGTYAHLGGDVIVRVGQGGAQGGSASNTAFGGGGYGGTASNGFYGGGGGGLSGVFLPVGGALGSGTLHSRSLLVAGGGGGRTYTVGAGGGTNGQTAPDSGNGGGGDGGTQTAGGAGGHRGASYGSTGAAGTALTGGRGGTGDRSGGGGGGGYYGGGGGGSNNYLGAGGGGGSGFAHATLLTNRVLTGGSGAGVANASHPQRGNAGSPSTTRIVSGLHRGWDGVVIITRSGDL